MLDKVLEIIREELEANPYAKICVYTGRATKDAELRYTPSGKAVLNFTLAVNFTKDDAEFFSVAAWEELAEALNGKVNKGNTLTIVGKRGIQKWSKQGEDKTIRSISALPGGVFFGKVDELEAVELDNCINDTSDIEPF